MAKCPACAESIPADVDHCPYCGISVHQQGASGAVSTKGKSSVVSTLLVVAGVGVLVLLICGGIAAALLLPAVQQAREAARRSQCKGHLKQIALALHNYHDTYNCFPPAVITDAAGKPMHSWRVLILPFLDQNALYEQYRFEEPWDGPNNSQLLGLIPQIYQCPSEPTPGTNTAYAGVFGPKSVFRGTHPTKISAITDGTTNTLAVGEVTSGAMIPWMKPADVDITLHPTLGDPAGFNSHHVGGVHFMLVDGSVRYISVNVDAATLQGLYTINGDEIPGEF